FSDINDSNFPDSYSDPSVNIFFDSIDLFSGTRNNLELILAFPPFLCRDQLLVYFIFAGAKLSDTAKEEWKREYDIILNRLKTAYEKALIVVHYNLAEKHQLQFPHDLRPQIFIDLFYAEMPELKSFPVKKLTHGLKLLDQKPYLDNV